MLNTDILTDVVIVDANPVISAGLCSLLNGYDNVNATAFPPEALIEAGGFEGRTPAIVILDPAAAGMSETAGRPLLEKLATETSLVGYTDSRSLELVRFCIDAGFRGYISKKADFDQLPAALNVVIRGGVFVDETLLDALIHGTNGAESINNNSALSDRELQVLRSIAHGYSTKEIAAELGVSTKTVETYKHRASSKLGLNSRAEIVNHALANNWMTTK